MKQYEVPGQLVDIGGYRLHLLSTGNGGLSQPIAALIQEMKAMEASYAEARRVGTRPNALGALPLAVVKHALHGDRLPPRASADLVQRYAQAFETAQAELAGLSSNSQVFTADKSGHSIHIDQPARVVEAVRWVLDSIRQQFSPGSIRS